MALTLSSTVTPIVDASKPDFITQLLTYSIVLATAILVVVTILYFYKPAHRKIVGLIALTLGGLGSAISLGVILFTIINNIQNLGVFVTVILFCLEIPTIFVGIQSLKNSRVPKN